MPTHRGRFLILSVEAGPGRQGGKVDKEDFIQKMVCLASVFVTNCTFLLRISSLVTLSALSSKSCPHDNVKYLPL
jgi:hypothetical protein